MRPYQAIATSLFCIVSLAACGGSQSGDSTPSSSEASKTKHKLKAAVIRPENVAGTISATINGEPFEWTAQKDQSEWFHNLDAPQSFISVHSYPSLDQSIPGNIVFTINRYGDRWVAVKIYVRPFNSDIRDFSTSNDGASTFEVKSASMEGDQMKLTGTFTATLPALNKIGEDPDMSNILKVENGTFDLIIPPRR